MGTRIGAALIIPGVVLLSGTGGDVQATTVARGSAPRLLGFGAMPTTGGVAVGATFAY